MAWVKLLDCASCGGPVDIASGRDVVECSYCGRSLRVEREGNRTTIDLKADLKADSNSGHDDQSRRLIDDLLRGHSGDDVGDGRRFSVAEMRARDWVAHERTAWPVATRASSTFGRSWSHEVVRDAPRVYPRYGDLPGAWAPRRRTSHTEWLEVQFSPEVGLVEAIRVFETCAAGSTFALTVRDQEGRERLIWKRPPVRPMSEAQVLEVSLGRPERVTSVRAYVTNDQATWTQIDTVGLLAVEPIATHLRRYPVRPARRSQAAALIVVVLVLALVGAGAALYIKSAMNRTGSGQSNSQPADSPPPGDRRDRPRAVPAVPKVVLSDSAMKPWTVTPDELARSGIRWAASSRQASSEYQASRWSRHQLVGRPDVFPAHADNERAWATERPDDGLEWVTVEFDADVRARAVVIVETFNPGALIRVDDITRSDAPVGLWRGTTDSAGTSRVLRLTLPTGRRIVRLRLLLDTSLVAGWNEIDAVGLLEHRPI